jgi:hypothetical protein
MSSVTEVSKVIKLDLSGIPSDKVTAAKKEVGDYLIEEILRYVGDGKSPVEGERWKKLTKEYADEFKGGNTTPTMQLYGDLLDSLKTEDAGEDKIKIGHFKDEGQAPKADGHNQLSIEAKLWAQKKDFPKRRYIPDNGQKFKSAIESGIEDILSGYRRKEDVERVGRISGVEQGLGEVTGDIVSVGVEDLFSEDVIISLIDEVKRRRR